MATVENTLSVNPEAAAGAKSDQNRAWVEYAPAALMALAFTPILLLHAKALWARPHYQFFPLVIPGAAALVWKWCGGLGRLETGRGTLGRALGGFAWLLLALSILCISPGLGALGFLALTLGAAYTLGGWRLTLPALPAWSLLWLAIPPPRHYDVALIVKLQTIVSRWSDKMLDLMGVYHIMDGNVVDIGGQPLLVDQACSGIYSLLTLLIGTLFYVLWVRVAPLRAIVLMGAAVVWVMAGNLSRILAVVLLKAWFDIDAASGWKHEMLGLVMFAGMLGMVLSTDRLLTYVQDSLTWIWSKAVAVQGIAAPRKRGKRGKADFLAVSGGRGRSRKSAAGAAEPSETPKESPEDDAAEPAASEPELEPVASGESGQRTVLPDLSRTWLGSWPTAGAFGALFVASLMIPGAQWKDVLLAGDVYQQLFAPMKAEAMPATFGPFQFSRFEESDRSEDSSWGEHSNVWIYGSQQGVVAVVSLDYEFVDWHELTDCYVAQGWKMISRRVSDAPAPGTKIPEAGAPSQTPGGGGPLVEVEFMNSDGRYKYLVFGLYDRKGRPIEPLDQRGALRSLTERAKSWIRTGDGGGRDAEVLCYQLQVFAENEAALSEEGKLAVRLLHAKARDQAAQIGLKTKQQDGGAK